MQKTMLVLIALVLLFAIYAMTRPQTAEERYEERITNCRTLAREELYDALAACQSELPGLARAAADERRP